MREFAVTLRERLELTDMEAQMVKVGFLAHPVRGDIEANLARALRWVKYLEEWHKVAIVAPWMQSVKVWDDANDRERKAGIDRNKAVIAKCDAFYLVGGQITEGMNAELRHTVVVNERRAQEFDPLIEIFDLTDLGPEPPK